jgi:hypothetical protein
VAVLRSSAERAQLVQHPILQRNASAAAEIAAGQDMLDQGAGGGAGVAIED